MFCSVYSFVVILMCKLFFYSSLYPMLKMDFLFFSILLIQHTIHLKKAQIKS